ncbi:MAG: hypothetical protein Q9219_003397 [cf. Caloplaca sp. 3 TL-2023]
MDSSSETSKALFLFGGPKPWIPPSWHTSDDRVRGGSSRSSLSALPDNCASFNGHLDIETLGGAGFASQFQFAPCSKHGRGTASGCAWDLSTYDGIEIDVKSADEKIYTLIVKDEEPQAKRNDGREQAGVNWEADFRVPNRAEYGIPGQTRGGKVWIPWCTLKPTYRGKEKDDAGKFQTGKVRRIGLMMRSYFGTQQGDFQLEILSLSARSDLGRIQ